MADVRVHLPFGLHLPFSQMRTHCVFVVNCVSQPSFWLIYLWIRYLYKRSCSCSRNVGVKVQRQSTAKLPGNPVTRDGLISFVASVQATCCSLCSKYHWCAAPVEELWGGSSVEPPLRSWHKLFPDCFFPFFIYQIFWFHCVSVGLGEDSAHSGLDASGPQRHGVVPSPSLLNFSSATETMYVTGKKSIWPGGSSYRKNLQERVCSLVTKISKQTK